MLYCLCKRKHNECAKFLEYTISVNVICLHYLRYFIITIAHTSFWLSFTGHTCKCYYYHVPIYRVDVFCTRLLHRYLGHFLLPSFMWFKTCTHISHSHVYSMCKGYWIEWHAMWYVLEIASQREQWRKGQWCKKKYSRHMHESVC